MDVNNNAEEGSPFETAIANGIEKLAGISHNDALSVIEPSKKLEIGDYCIPIPKINKIKRLEGKPNDIAKQWAEQFTTNEIITSVSSEGIYLNFKVNKAFEAVSIAKKVWETQSKYGWTNQGNGKTVIVEYSSPNIAKPFHAGHLRTTIIGNFLKNLHQALGYKAIGINYLGDWGKQFGLLAIGYGLYGSDEKLAADPIKHLYEIYVKINEAKKEDPNLDEQARAYFKRMEDGDPSVLQLWQKFRDMSITEYNQMYKRLNVHFDEYSGESKFGTEMNQEIKKMEELNLLHQEETGAQVVDLQKEGLGVVIIKKKDGATLYITRDIAAAHSRKIVYNFDKMFYVVGSEQSLHFQQLFTLLSKMGYTWSQNCVHTSYGIVQQINEDGKKVKLSTRNGVMVFVQDILNIAKDKMKEIMQKNEEKYKEIEDPDTVADIIGISAVVIQDLSSRLIKDYVFDLDSMTSFQGDTGPYLQYSHARMCSVERKAVAQGATLTPEADVSLLVEKEAQDLFSLVGKYPTILQQAFHQSEPCVVVTYAMSLSHAISNAIEKLRVIGVERNLSEARLLMFWCARITLGNAIRLLGLTPLERM